jgi:iron(III) transport system substrate-binding protein
MSVKRACGGGSGRGLLHVFACALAFICAPAPSFAQPADTAALALYQGPDRAKLLLDGARREGELTLYSSMQVDSILPLQKGFESKYGVHLRLWRGSGKDILRRALAEASANRNDVDILESDGFALEALYRENVLQPVSSPYLDDLMPEALRPNRQWVGTRLNIFAGVYNTDLVRKGNLPQTYQDLLKPGFKGMLGMEADDYDWFGMLAGLMGETQTLALFHDIVARNGVSVRKGHTLLTNLVAAGEVPIGLNVFMQNADVARGQGAPVDWFLIPPTIARPNAIAMARRSPHPHAALLFYDFMLSDGQRIMLGRDFVPTSRKVASVADRIKLNFVSPDLVLDQGPKWQKLYADTVLNGAR